MFTEKENRSLPHCGPERPRVNIPIRDKTSYVRRLRIYANRKGNSSARVCCDHGAERSGLCHGYSSAKHLAPVKDTSKAVDFKGKTITIIVGSSAGGGWDTGARSTALTLQKILPGNPRVVVQNIPGGDGDRALRRLGDRQTPRDGTFIMPVHGRFFLDAILGKPHPYYDLRSNLWLR